MPKEVKNAVTGNHEFGIRHAIELLRLKDKPEAAVKEYVRIDRKIGNKTRKTAKGFAKKKALNVKRSLNLRKTRSYSKLSAIKETVSSTKSLYGPFMGSNPTLRRVSPGAQGD